MSYPSAASSRPDRPPRPHRRRRISFMTLLLAAVGLVTVLVFAMRYAIVPLLVMLKGVV